MELPAKLRDYFLRSNKNNINQTPSRSMSLSFLRARSLLLCGDCSLLHALAFSYLFWLFLSLSRFLSRAISISSLSSSSFNPPPPLPSPRSRTHSSSFSYICITDTWYVSLTHDFACCLHFANLFSCRFVTQGGNTFKACPSVDGPTIAAALLVRKKNKKQAKGAKKPMPKRSEADKEKDFWL